MKLEIVGLKKSVQSRIMISGIHTTPIYIEGIGDDKKESIKKFLYKINFGISDEWAETECMTTAAHGSTHVIDGEADVIFNKYGLFIYDLVIDKAHKFLEQLGIKNLKLTVNSCRDKECKNCAEMWGSKYTKGHYQGIHNHVDNGELFSFVYFAKYDPSKDADLIFVKDMTMANANGYLTTEINEYKELEDHPAFSNHVSLDVKEGDLVIFPSYLDHFVEEQKTEGPRITIAGNLYKDIEERTGKCKKEPIYITPSGEKIKLTSNERLYRPIGQDGIPDFLKSHTGQTILPFQRSHTQFMESRKQKGDTPIQHKK